MQTGGCESVLDVKRYRSVIACIGLSIILVLSLFNSALNILTLLITCLIVLTWDVEDSICILMFIISFERVFKLQLGGFALLNVVEVVFVIRLLYARNFKLPMKAGMPGYTSQHPPRTVCRNRLLRSVPDLGMDLWRWKWWLR